VSKAFWTHLRQLGYLSYGAYLASDHWQGFRKQYRASGRPQYCIACGDPEYQLHHRTYTRLGCELLGDVIPLCRKCHVKVHEYLKAVDGSRVGATHAILRRIFGWTKGETTRRFAPFSINERGGGIGWVPRKKDRKAVAVKRKVRLRMHEGGR
jgi:hypothetical protein